PADQEAIVDSIRRAAAAIGLHHGPVHAECRVNADGVFVLEVAARPIGGICARALRFGAGGSGLGTRGSGICLEELLVRHALGEAPSASPASSEWTREPDASGVMMIPIPKRGMLRGVSGVDDAKAVDHVTDVRITAKLDQMLVPLPEGSSYLGFLFARAACPADVDRALRAAHAALEFRIDGGLAVLSGREIQYNRRHG